jgi:hypothetical protein
LRKERTAQMQLINRQNTWLRLKTDTCARGMSRCPDPVAEGQPAK